MICKMSLQTLPILFINLGGEMMYILDQRLRAQNIPKEKATKGKCRAEISLTFQMSLGDSYNNNAVLYVHRQTYV